MKRGLSPPANNGRFRLMSRRATDALLRLREAHSLALRARLCLKIVNHSNLNNWKLWSLAVDTQDLLAHPPYTCGSSMIRAA
jgi:hypothetical protein